MSSFDARRVRADTPALARIINGQRITYLDSGATSLPPRAVIEAMSRYYELRHANVHRSVFQTASEATATYEGARESVAHFINAPGGAGEVVFTKNTTESFNLLAKSWGEANLSEGDVVLLSEMEHHANIVPWFMLRERTGIEVRFIPVTDDFRLDLSSVDELMEDVKLVSVTAMSNVLGTINPVKELAATAHAHGALIAVDGAQSVAHDVTDVADLDIDFFAFSAHKMLGPTGIGVFWTRAEILDAMPPFLGGGGMIADVRLDGYSCAGGPTRFEAGTPPIAEAAGLGAAVRYLEGLGMANVAEHERALTGDALTRLGLDQFGGCVRPGHHCAKPLMRRFSLPATVRASYGPYSLVRDTDVLIEGLRHAIEMFA